jgi:uroporphyrinogen decarboxylase
MAAGSDPLIVRQRHPRCAIIGGMDKRVLASGRDGIDAELRRVQPLWEDGAYIPMLDHFVPPDLSYDDYRYYVERRREMLSRPIGGK